MGTKKVRIEEVASRAHVSTATVSRAVRGLPGVGKATCAHVLQVAAELGYTPSHSAASLASGSMHTVGLVLPDASRWFFANAIEAAERTLREHDYDALVYTLSDYYDVGRKTFDPEVLRSKVDAVVVLSLFFDDHEVDLLRSLNVPAAFLSVDQPGFSCVGIDDELAMTKACEHLIGLGHKVIGHLSGMTNDKCPNAPTQRRRDAWRNALRDHNLEFSESLDSPSDIMTARNGFTAASVLLDRRPDVTAIVSSSDEMAMGAIQALRSRGIEPGRQVSVVGIDGNDLAFAFGLTSVEQPVRKESRRAIELLLQAIDGDEEVHKEVFDTNLVVRSSSGQVMYR